MPMAGMRAIMQTSPQTRSRTRPCICAAQSGCWQLLCLGAMLCVALAANDAQAGVITALGAMAPQNEIGAAGAGIPAVSSGGSKASSEWMKLSEPWRLWAAGGLFGAGAGAGSTASAAGFSSASAAVWGAPLYFRPSTLARGTVAERHCLLPPLVRLEGPFHPPRNRT
jgi:hypothetical protein